MKNKNIPAIITLLAGVLASVTCILNNYPLSDTLTIVLISLLVFYIFGLIVGKIVNRINQTAKDAYTEEERIRMEEENLKQMKEKEVEDAKSKEESNGANTMQDLPAQEG